MQILDQSHFESYNENLQFDLETALNEISATDARPENFTFYTSVAVISSSKIEGEPMEIDSYLKHKLQNIDYVSELTEKPNDLYNAYLFAKENPLNEHNFLESHNKLSEHLLPVKDRGVFRKNEMLVMEHKTGRIQYEAAQYSILEKEMEKLWSDIKHLLIKSISVEETFYYAAYIHLVFVNIHPFNDGNGRAARLLEKWFLSKKLGNVAWFIPSEKYYYHNVDDYYRNLNRLGMFYENLDHSRANKFFQMLPNSLNYKG